MRDTRVIFTRGVYPRATVCTVHIKVCNMFSATHPCRRNGSLFSMEVKRKMKIGEEIARLAAIGMWDRQRLSSVGMLVGLMVQ